MGGIKFVPPKKKNRNILGKNFPGDWGFFNLPFSCNFPKTKNWGKKKKGFWGGGGGGLIFGPQKSFWKNPPRGGEKLNLIFFKKIMRLISLWETIVLVLRRGLYF